MKIFEIVEQKLLTKNLNKYLKKPDSLYSKKAYFNPLGVIDFLPHRGIEIIVFKRV
jgi:hypothetical protein